MDNLFSSYKLFSTLRSYGIGACGTVRANRMEGEFTTETDDKQNGKILQWGELRTKCLFKEGGEMVLAWIWQDQAVVKGLTTIHDGKGYMIKARRRPRDSATMPTKTKAIFDIFTSSTNPQQPTQRFYSSKLALPVTKLVDDYNTWMNGVDRHDQLREDYSTYQITRRSWLPYWFFLLDAVIINSFILWRMEEESQGKVRKDRQKQRDFRESLIASLIKDVPRVESWDVRIDKKHTFKAPNAESLPTQYHQISDGLAKKQCYYCRFRSFQGARNKVQKTAQGCYMCSVPLCSDCFLDYHQLGSK